MSDVECWKLNRMRQLEEENLRLLNLVNDKQIENAELQAKLEGKDEKHKEDLVFLVQQCLKDSIQKEILKARREGAEKMLRILNDNIEAAWAEESVMFWLERFDKEEQSLKQEEDKEKEPQV